MNALEQIVQQRENIVQLLAENNQILAENKRLKDEMLETGRRLCIVSGLLTRYENKDLQWTKEKPVIDGYYWYRLDEFDCDPVIVDVYPLDWAADLPQKWLVEFTDKLLKLDEVNGQFSGPIPKPAGSQLADGTTLEGGTEILPQI